MSLLRDCFDTAEFKEKMFTRSNGGWYPKLEGTEGQTNKYQSIVFQGEQGFQMALWWEPGDDTPGLVSRSRRVVGTMMEMLGEDKELYLLSSKLIAKEGATGGSFAWHQVCGNWLFSPAERGFIK